MKIKYLQYSKSYRSYVCNSHVYFINVLQYNDENIQENEYEIIIIVSQNLTYDAFNNACT